MCIYPAENSIPTEETPAIILSSPQAISNESSSPTTYATTTTQLACFGIGHKVSKQFKISRNCVSN